MSGFSNDYYYDEVREGFFVPGMVKRCWAAQINVLNVIDEICKKYNLKWYADYGTLIGAVRHKGCIPWDDDIDICMFRDDYNKFLEIVSDNIPEGYRILSIYHENNYDKFLSRLMDGSEIILNNDYIDSHCGFPYPAGVDIFPIDYVYDDFDKEKDRKERANLLLQLIEATVNTSSIDESEILEIASNICGYRLKNRTTVFNTLMRAYENVLAECKDRDTENVAYMYFFCKNGSHKYSRRLYNETIRLPFENITVNAPIGYMEILKNNYGEWWKVNRKGGIHEYPMFSEMERVLREAMGGKLPYKYSFRHEHLNFKKDLSDSNLEIFKVVDSANQIIEKYIEQGDYSAVLKLLINSQELMINAGTSIENTYGEDIETVKIIEQYCEALYCLSEVLKSDNTSDCMKSFNKLHRCLKDVVSSYEDSCLGMNDVIFMPFNARYWDKMQDAYYKELKAGGRVRVIPIPYYDKSYFGEHRGCNYNLEEYPGKINVEDYRTYDISAKYPAKIYIQNPYDGYNSAIGVPVEYYSQNLVNNTKELIYIPYFDIDDIDNGDERSLANTEYYIKMPGVVYSDRIILKSEKLKNIYVEILKKMAGEDTGGYWDSKIEIIKPEEMFSTKNQNNITIKDIPKKNILYYSSISDVYTKGVDFLKKLDSVVRIFEDNKEKVKLIWLQEYEFKNHVKRLFPDMYNAFEECESYLENKEIGIVHCADNIDKYSKLIEELVETCDAYYGPGGYVMNQCVRKKIPVMIHNIELT